MKTKQLLQEINKPTFIQDYLRACGVEDVEEYLAPTGKYVDPPMNYTDMDKGIKMLHKALKSPTEFRIIQDCDVDGICSAVLTYQFLIHLGVSESNIKVIYHTSKQHGLSEDIMDVLGLEVVQNIKPFVILPDAGTNDVEQCKFLTEFGCKVLILDHHDKETDNPYATIINNQMSDNVQNKALSGAGVTWKFITAYCKEYLEGDKYYTELIDIVHLSNLADVRDMRVYENRTIAQWAIITNPFLLRLKERFIKDKLTPKGIVWNIVPKLNAVCRLGGDSEAMAVKEQIFKAFFEKDEDIIDGAITAMLKAHTSQQTKAKNIFDKTIKEHECSDNKVEVVKIEPSAYTGLVANKLMDYYNKPILLVHEQEYSNELRGSMRSPYPLKDILNDSGLMIFAQGHEQACGVAWDDTNTKSLMRYCNKVDIPEPVIEVCCEYTPEKIPHNIFDIFDEYDFLYGTNLPHPIFRISSIHITNKDIKILGKTGKTIKFTHCGVDYLKFSTTDEEKEMLRLNTKELVDLEVEVIGTLEVNSWHGIINEQVTISKLECQEYKKTIADIW